VSNLNGEAAAKHPRWRIKAAMLGKFQPINRGCVPLFAPILRGARGAAPGEALAPFVADIMERLDLGELESCSLQQYNTGPCVAVCTHVTRGSH